MSEQGLSYEELLRIIEMIRASDGFAEFHLKIGDVELDLRKAGAMSSAPPIGASAAATPASVSQAAPKAAARKAHAPPSLWARRPAVWLAILGIDWKWASG